MRNKQIIRWLVSEKQKRVTTTDSLLSLFKPVVCKVPADKFKIFSEPIGITPTDYNEVYINVLFKDLKRGTSGVMGVIIRPHI